MRILIKIVLLGILFSVSVVAVARDPGTPLAKSSVSLNKVDIARIKIISPRSDRFTLFITGQDARKYRISGLSEQQAHGILERLKTGTPLNFDYQGLDSREYLDVQTWH